MTPSAAKDVRSSRTDRSAAGWERAGKATGTWVELARRPVFRRKFSWLRPRVLLESRNSVLAELIRRADTDIVNDERRRWTAARRAAGVSDLTIDAKLLRSFDCLLVGDTGEGDPSQYVLVPHLKDYGHDTNCMVILSDVIYPTGESNDYVDSFYRPYRDYPRAIYALPGNHDWYTLLTGFMWHFCGAEPLPPPAYRLSSYTWQERLARFLWLRPRTPNRTLLTAYRNERWAHPRPDGSHRALSADDPDCTCGPLPATPPQPGPYFAIETNDLVLVAIDTGTSGTIDREQGEWLCRVALSIDKPKILLTGKPIYVNHTHKPCRIEWDPVFNRDKDPDKTGSPAPRRLEGREKIEHPSKYPTVDAIVRDPDCQFIAAIGGDTHNYQRYPVTVRDGCEVERVVQYVVSGGGGAFTSPTHILDNASPGDPAGITEDEFRCYPLRGDSLARFSRGATNRLRVAVLLLAILSLALLVAALNVWNPKDSGIDEKELWFVPLGWVQYVNWAPDSGLLGVAVLSWLGGGDYDFWIPRGLAIALLAAGATLLFLPWFRLRVKVVAALVALVAAGFLAGLVDWHVFVAGAAVAAAASVLLPRELVRAVPVVVRALAIIGLAALAAALFEEASRSDVTEFWAAVGAFGAVAILLVGGPPVGLKTGFVAAGTIALLAGALWTIEAGYFELVLLGLGLLLSLFTIYALLALRWVLVSGTNVDPDQAASHVAGLLATLPVRAIGASGASGVVQKVVSYGMGKALSALLPKKGGDRRFLLYFFGETVYSALYDSNGQPFFKSFLRLEARDGEVKIYCVGVADEDCATVEDHVKWCPERGWTTVRALLGGKDVGGVLGEVDYYRQGSSGDPELVFDLGPSPSEFWVHLKRDTASDWEPAGKLSYRSGNRKHALRVAAPARGWFTHIGLSHVGEGAAPPPEPSYATGVFV